MTPTDRPAAPSPRDTSRILTKMLERLFSALVNGPSLNCKPHNSRQRVDLTQLKKLRDIAPEEVLRALLGPDRSAKITAKVPAPPKKIAEAVELEEEQKLTAEQKAAAAAWADQTAVFNKTRTIAEDAKTYENDTGVHVLHIGFPLLSLPPGSGGLQKSLTRRILAPLAFVSVSVSVKGGSAPSVTLDCKNEGADLVVPNVALLSWLEQQTGKAAEELFADEAGEKPWEEIAGIVRRTCSLLDLAPPPLFATVDANAEGAPLPAFELQPPPRSDDDDAQPSVVLAAVLGLFPMANQGLLRDTQAMIAEGVPAGPVQSFLEVDASIAQQPEIAAEPGAATAPPKLRNFAEERLVTAADPCQARAVALARTSRGLVIYGPPGTGKSQTITNIIGDHLARAQRVLMVCDKRTALDVVMNRLNAMGLGQLCAVVHDPQRDQRDLYKAIREQLENLTTTNTSPGAEKQLAAVDAELQKLHAELTAYHAALMAQDSQGRSFHEFMGQWLTLPALEMEFKDALLEGTTPEQFQEQEHDAGEVLERAAAAGYPMNPWTKAAGLPLATYLTTPLDDLRGAMAACVTAATEADATLDANIPPFLAAPPLSAQADQRVALAERLGALLARADAAVLTRWAKAELKAVRQSRQKLIDAAAFTKTFHEGPLDGELATIVRAAPPSLPAIAAAVLALDNYLAIASKWFAFFCFGPKNEAGKALAVYGLTLSVENARRLRGFLVALRSRLVLQGLRAELAGEPASASLLSDEAIESSIDGHAALFDLLIHVAEQPALAPLSPLVNRGLADSAAAASLIDGLKKSPARADALTRLESAVIDANLFNEKWRGAAQETAHSGKPIAPAVENLLERFDTLEGILRAHEGLQSLSAPVRAGVTKLIQQDAGAEAGLTVLKRAVLAMEIARRLKDDPALQRIDGQRLKTSFERYRVLEQQKQRLVRDQLIHFWTTKQKQRLLAATGSRLNGQGADLRRRFTITGRRAMRLRQVIQVGQEIEGGDPLFDLRPVWMASPETVAQLFPRLPLFDVVIFDEASQCRLEEALPVLTRAQRVVIAGDPKQLPPTRFFESAAVSSDEEEIESDQQLFEVQQRDIEDLLNAALNIEIHECYLDVHYRSRNADLIEFSNQHFYGSRLQSIPAHPSNRARYAPLTLYKAEGVYEKRANVKEAERVCRIVADLLKRAEPPSIGIACFNMTQRDTIVEKLDDLAAEDPEFGRRLAEARLRRSGASFEGLFVKNLENVQGDERDHIIISTTYGPDAQGRFYKRFGPLGMAGGGRRLNVLVTRARQEVHLVTSIPESVYRALPPIPPGEVPGGGWLLFSYLAYAEILAGAYEKSHAELAAAETEAEAAAPPATVNVKQTRYPSTFAQALGRRFLQQRNAGSDVHWGNDGFCVDVVLHHPRRAEDVTVGVLTDLTRFGLAADPVEWDIFRTAVLENQGWKLHRIWTPHFFRDPQGVSDGVFKEAAAVLAAEDEKDALRVSDPDAKPPAH